MERCHTVGFFVNCFTENLKTFLYMILKKYVSHFHFISDYALAVNLSLFHMHFQLDIFFPV